MHLLDDDGRPRAYDVRLGVSDGAMTELVAPVPAALHEGVAVVTSAVPARPRAAGPRPGPRAPF